MYFRHSHFRHRHTPALMLALLAWAMLVFNGVFSGVLGGIPGGSVDAAKLSSADGCGHMQAMSRTPMSTKADESAADAMSIVAEKHAQNAMKDDCCCAHGPIGLLTAQAGAAFELHALSQDWLALVPQPPQPQTRRLLRPPLA